MMHTVFSAGVISIKNTAHCSSFALWWLIKTYESTQSKRYPASETPAHGHTLLMTSIDRLRVTDGGPGMQIPN